jgi:hypothetical protein
MVHGIVPNGDPRIPLRLRHFATLWLRERISKSLDEKSIFKSWRFYDVSS